jgi:diguanylate cyclase (GGDEF)-like protein
MALLDPRLLEIEILSEADRATFSGGPAYQYQRTGTTTQEGRQQEAALLELMSDRSIVSAMNYSFRTGGSDPNYALAEAAGDAVAQLLNPSVTIIHLKITQRGRLRLFRARDEILAGRDRIRDDFGILWAGRHFVPDLTVHLRSREPGTPISVLVVDVDKLTDLNSHLGHPGANKVLIGIFEELRDAVGPHQGYRTGGDELSAILVGVTLEKATEIANRIRSRVETREWPELSFKKHPTVSIGVGTLTEDMDAAAFNAAVDRLTYRAKEPRNTVVAATVPES